MADKGVGQQSAPVDTCGLAGLAAFAAIVLWPGGAGEIIEHSHDDLPVDHPHLREAGVDGCR